MIRAEASAEDIRRFEAAMERFKRECRKSPKQAVSWAAANLARSLKARTAKAKPYPKIVSYTSAKGVKYWRREDDIKGGLVGWLRQDRHTRDDARERYRRRKAGLARRMWAYAASKSSAEYMEVQRDDGDENPSITFNDRLRYALEAMGGSMGDAVAASGRAMMKKIDADIARAMR